MTRLAFLFLMIAMIPATVLAGDVTYVATMSGIECTECKKSIAKALGKIDGVKTIRIAKGDGENHTLTVVTDGTSPISKSRAVEALGKDAPHYQIKSWSKSS